jgi:diguanylate cyclase (GGDEF)-like protein
MIRPIDRFLSVQTMHIVGMSILLVVITGAFDILTGYEISISVFYTIPVWIGSWYLGKRFGIFVCIIAAITWYTMDFASGHEYSNPSIAIWNTGVGLSFFLIIAILLDRLRLTLNLQGSLVRLDGLTGILNARAFRERCDYLFGLARRNDHSLVIGYIDLDDFKGVNDRFGHRVGDQVLQEVSRALSKRLRSSDMGSRVGGDEFAVLLPETDLAGAETFFCELHQGLIELSTRNGWPVGFSMGVAVFHPVSPNTAEAILYADNLMCRVKNSGKNNILFEQYPGESLGT